MLFAIDTSCDETAVTLLKVESLFEGESLSENLIASEIVSSQIKLHQPYGGVVPELAAREHLLNLPVVVETAFREAGCRVEDIKAVAVTRGPGLNGCLLVGLCFAKAFAAGRGIPLVPVNHVEGHMFAGELLGVESHMKYPAMALTVSGGHTLLLSVDSFRHYDVLAQTRDDAAGEAFDKSANVLGLMYPGGALLSKKAETGNAQAYPLPLGVPDDFSAFSFSGLKTAVLRLSKALGEKLNDASVLSDVCASVQHAIVEALVRKTVYWLEKKKPIHFTLAGGVAANSYLRSRLKDEMDKRGIKFVVPPIRWCTDNASMIAALGARIIEHDSELYKHWDSNNLVMGKIGPTSSVEVNAVPRWPLTKLFEI